MVWPLIRKIHQRAFRGFSTCRCPYSFVYPVAFSCCSLALFIPKRTFIRCCRCSKPFPTIGSYWPDPTVIRTPSTFVNKPRNSASLTVCYCPVRSMKRPNCGSMPIAKRFCFPLLPKDFGLPVAEAMTFGKPVFISNRTSLPEVGGKEAYYFENFEPENMAKVLHDGLHDFGQNSVARRATTQTSRRI